MIVYQVNIEINPIYREDWLNWMCQKHIPDVLETNCFVKASLLRDKENENSFICQYEAESQNKLDEYFNNYAPTLRQEHTLRYEGKFVANRKVFEIVKNF